jgi:hypothetical protein
MLAEFFDGCVAAGTLALAAVTWRLARSTVTMVNESRTARLDALAPAVTVLQFWHEVKPVQPRRVAGVTPADIEPGTLWDMTQYGAHLIGIRVRAMIANEGQTTARVALTPGSDVEIESVEYEEVPSLPEQSGSTGAAAPTNIAQQSGAYLLRPGMEVRVSAILWRTTTQWGKEWTAADGAPPSALGYVDVAVTSGSALVHDTCQLEFGRYPLVPHPTKDGWVIAAIGMTTVIAQPPPPPVAIIGRMERVYGVMEKTVAPSD